MCSMVCKSVLQQQVADETDQIGPNWWPRAVGPVATRQVMANGIE